MDVEILSRIQFAFTIAFHYIYPPLSIGLGMMLVFMEGLYLKTGDSLDINKTVKFRHMTQNNFLRDSVLTFVKTPRNDVGFELEINYLDILKGLDISSSERIIIFPEYVIPTNVFNFKL